MKSKTGEYLFVISVVMAVVLALFESYISPASNSLWSLIITLSLLAGFFIDEHRVKEFLGGSIALIAIGYFAKDQISSWSKAYIVGQYAVNLFGNLLAIFAPMAATAAVKHLFKLVMKED